MTSAGELSLAPSIAQRFQEAVETLATLNERWAALATTEEQQKLTSESLTAAAAQIADMSRTMASTCEVVQEAIAELQSAAAAANAFLENTDFTQLRTEMKELRDSFETMHREATEKLTAQLQQAVTERDAALAEAESAARSQARTRQELESKLVSIEIEHADLKARAEELPKRMRRRLLGD